MKNIGKGKMIIRGEQSRKGAQSRDNRRCANPARVL